MDNSLEFFDKDEKAGFRLSEAEVYNWGTFHQKIWTLKARGENTLLTGDIGSGKSTFIDAVTTLLVPSQRITYNKAAGAETRERSLRSYVLGHFKSERSESGLASKAVSLRDAKTYSVILGRFHNEGYSADVTLAQVFWFRDPLQPPARFYVVADKMLSIYEDFSNFGSDMNELRKRLRGQPEVEIFETFPPYGDAFRRRFGIGNTQALDLFAQTVSMKAVGNLTDFVRENMLEPADSQARVERLISHFDDLNRAHEAVLRALDQVNRLTPLVQDCEKHAEVTAEVDKLRNARDALRSWFAGIKLGLLEKRLSHLAVEKQRQDQKRLSLEESVKESRARRDGLRQAIAENGGDHLERLERDLAAAETERRRRKERSDRYESVAQKLGLSHVEDADGFVLNQASLKNLQNEWSVLEAELQNQRSEQEGSFRDLVKEISSLKSELDSLKKRPTNIPREQVLFRERLCTDLGLSPTELLFAGELMSVRPETTVWEPVAERVLRPFALSLLVPDELYTVVSSWVDQTDLKGRLVYFRVRGNGENRFSELNTDSLAKKIHVKEDSPFRAWIEAQLALRFDYVCCESLDRFRREKQALTPAGQIKVGGERHEKDDRQRLGDRTRFVLGWSNEPKIKALDYLVQNLERKAGVLGEQLAQIQDRLRGLQLNLQGAAQLASILDFSEIDWRSLARSLVQLEAERDALRSSNDRLKILTAQLEELEEDLKIKVTELEALVRAEGQLTERIKAAENLYAEAKATQGTLEGKETAFEFLTSAYNQNMGSGTITVESADNRERDFRDFLQGRIDAEEQRLKRLQEKIVRAMQEYRSSYPQETREMDASLASAAAFQGMLKALTDDDLPRFERQFKELLNENTIREVANFQSQLARDRQTIKERIDFINKSLTQIDYNPGRFIRLEADPSADQEIREFTQELRACTEGSLTGSGNEQYSESKFLQVKKIVERFRGRAGFEELDRRWTEKVSDVRQAFAFSASERWKEDNTEFEHYTDSAGKSGGQKEKLAYTVLAASLAYQFGLEWGAVRSRTFRFVVIDEAFGRGSDESTRYGLRLFGQLNLQLLIVTPLQKISVIEPFVASVGFVSNEDGRESQLRNLTIEDYRLEKAQRAKAGQL
jgi:uncharacterized protein YPO0396